MTGLDGFGSAITLQMTRTEIQCPVPPALVQPDKLE